MTIDTAGAAIIITVLIALLALAYGYGILTQKVTSHALRQDSIKEEFKVYQTENKAEHKVIGDKLDCLLRRPTE